MNIKKMNVSELNSNEFKQVNGGFLLGLAVGLFIGALNDADNNPDDFKAGANYWN